MGACARVSKGKNEDDHETGLWSLSWWGMGATGWLNGQRLSVAAPLCIGAR